MSKYKECLVHGRYSGEECPCCAEAGEGEEGSDGALDRLESFHPVVDLVMLTAIVVWTGYVSMFMLSNNEQVANALQSEGMGITQLDICIVSAMAVLSAIHMFDDSVIPTAVEVKNLVQGWIRWGENEGVVDRWSIRRKLNVIRRKLSVVWGVLSVLTLMGVVLYLLGWLVYILINDPFYFLGLGVGA